MTDRGKFRWMGPLVDRLSLRAKLVINIAFLVLILMVGTLALLSRAQLRVLSREVDEKIGSTSQLLAIQLQTPIVTGSRNEITSLAREVEKTSDVVFVAVVDSSNALLTTTIFGYHDQVLETDEFLLAMQSGRPQTVEITGSDGSRILTRIAPVVRFDAIEGAALVGFSRERVLEEVTSLRRTVMSLGAAGLLVGILMAGFLARGVIGPVERLKDAAVRVGAGEFGETVEVETEDEIGALAETFNAMSLELKKREEEIRRSERLSAIGTTASVIAHEMKTPLTSVQTYVDMLMYRYEDPEFRGKFTKTIEDQITRLGKLVDDLLDYSRDTRLHLTDLDLNLHLHQAVNFFGNVLLGHMVIAQEDYSARSLVRADPDKMEQVFFNLIKNGIEAQNEGGAIAIMTLEDDGNVVAMVADIGEGVPGDVKKSVFEPFFTTKAKGTGLGLAITRKIVEAHEGEIELYTPLETIPSGWKEHVRNTLGDHWPDTARGSCFAVKLPCCIENEV